MSIAVLDMSMSLDGFIADRNDYLGGADGHRLHNWFAPGGEYVEPAAEIAGLIDEMGTAGAVVAGRRTAELMDHWGGDHNGLPIFVPSHRPPAPAARWGYPLVTYVTEGIVGAMKLAKEAAGERHVHVIGGYTARTALEAGVLDEISVHLVPVVLGDGRGLFEVLGKHIELDIIRVIDTREATHLRYRVVR